MRRGAKQDQVQRPRARKFLARLGQEDIAEPGGGDQQPGVDQPARLLEQRRAALRRVEAQQRKQREAEYRHADQRDQVAFRQDPRAEIPAIREPPDEHREQRVAQAHQPQEQRRIVLEQAASHGRCSRVANSACRAATKLANSVRNRASENRAALARHASAVMRCAFASYSRTAAAIASGVCSRKKTPVGAGAWQPAYRFQRAAAAVGDHRRAPRLRFKRRDAEILVGGEHERAGAGEPPVAHVIRGAAQQPDIGSRRGSDARTLGPVADHHQLPIGQQPESRGDQVDALVRNETRHRDIGRPACRVRSSRCRGDRRIDHRRVTIVAVADALRDRVRDRDEAVDAFARGAVPAAQAGERAADDPAPNAAVEADLPQVLVLQVPRVAHRRVAVADVQLLARRAHALGHRVRTGDHEIVGGHVEVLDRAREKRQVAAKPRLREGQALDERRPYRPRSEACPIRR